MHVHPSAEGCTQHTHSSLPEVQEDEAYPCIYPAINKARILLQLSSFFFSPGHDCVPDTMAAIYFRALAPIRRLTRISSAALLPFFSFLVKKKTHNKYRKDFLFFLLHFVSLFLRFSFSFVSSLFLPFHPFCVFSAS